MRRFRFSIAGLMGLVGFCAFAAAALRFANPLWLSLVVTALLTALGVALLGMIFTRGPQRAFWIGFGLFGASYGILTLAPWMNEAYRPQLATTWALQSLARGLGPSVVAQDRVNLESWLTAGVRSRGVVLLADADPSTNSGWLDVITPALDPPGNAGGSFLFLTPRNSHDFQRIGHGLIALLAAMVGGLIAGRFARLARRETEIGRSQPGTSP